MTGRRSMTGTMTGKRRRKTSKLGPAQRAGRLVRPRASRAATRVSPRRGHACVVRRAPEGRFQSSILTRVLEEALDVTVHMAAVSFRAARFLRFRAARP